jgi:hypothetical protein
MKQKHTIVEEATTGLRMPEDVAEKIAELSKDLPKDFTYKRMGRTADLEEVAAEERAEVSVITTDAVDRDGEVVLPKGLDRSHFGGRVFLNHDYKDLQVGICHWIKPTLDGKGLKAKTHYPAKPKDWGDAPWVPSALLHFMQQTPPGMTGRSVGFLPLNVRQATAEEKSFRPEWKDRPIIDKAALLEFSVASIPCNPEAEMLAVSKALEAGEVDDEFAAMVVKSFEAHGAKIKYAPDPDMPRKCPKCGKPMKAGADGKHRCEAEGCGCAKVLSDEEVAAMTKADAEKGIVQVGVRDGFAEYARVAFVTEATIRKALERRGLDLKAQAEALIRQTFEDVMAVRTGKV